MRLALSWLPFLVAGFTTFAEAMENNHNDNYLPDQTKQFDEKKTISLSFFLSLSLAYPIPRNPNFIRSRSIVRWSFLRIDFGFLTPSPKRILLP